MPFWVSTVQFIVDCKPWRPVPFWGHPRGQLSRSFLVPHRSASYRATQLHLEGRPSHWRDEWCTHVAFLVCLERGCCYRWDVKLGGWRALLMAPRPGYRRQLLSILVSSEQIRRGGGSPTPGKAAPKENTIVESPSQHQMRKLYLLPTPDTSLLREVTMKLHEREVQAF